MNKKKWIPLAVLVAVIAMLGIALAVLNRNAAKNETEAAAEDAGIALCTLNVADAETIAYTTDAMNVSLTKNADGVWQLKNNPLLPLDQTKVEEIATNLASMTALRELGTDADTASMGFDAPQMTLTLTTSAGSSTLIVGSKNAMTDSYYVRTDASDSVYTVATTNLASLCKADTDLYAPQDITPLTGDEVTTMTVENGPETLNFTQTDGTWTLAEDAEYSLDQDLVSRMASTICDLQSAWSITNPEADSVYGLDAPNVTVTLRGNDGATVQCHFGAQVAGDDTRCYLTSSNATGIVYEVSADNLSAYAYTKATLQAATPETATTVDTANIIAEQPVGGANDYAN